VTKLTLKQVRENRAALLAMADTSNGPGHLGRRYMIHVCKDGTISYRDTTSKEPVLNGVALPVFSVNSVLEAEAIQVRFGRRQYHNHPDQPRRPWFRLSVLEDGTDPCSRNPPWLQVSDLAGVTRMFAKFYDQFTKGEST
jgi:hypothetical protein